MDLSTKVSKKMRLEDFLRQNLDAAPSPRIIEWVDRAAGVFRILWTHQSSGSFRHDDAALFRYWALARGKSSHQSSVELKQSLRMALNKSPCVERLPADALKPDYRYFRFVDTSQRSRSKSGRQRSMRSVCAELEPERRDQSVDSVESLWTHHVDQDQPINLSLDATKTNNRKQFSKSSNFLGKHGNNEAMDSDSCCTLIRECFSSTCKENIHYSSCMTHATTHVSETLTRRKECKNFSYFNPDINISCTNYDFVKAEPLETTAPKKPLFRPYALGDTTLNSDCNFMFNSQEIYSKNERTLSSPRQPYDQLTLLVEPKFSLEFKHTNARNYLGYSGYTAEEQNLLNIEGSVPGHRIMCESNTNTGPVHFQQISIPQSCLWQM